MVSKTDPDGTVIAYAFDAEGNQTARTLTLPGGLPRTQVHAYDGLNRLATVTDPDGGVTTHAYDAVGNRIEDAYPNGTVSTYTFDANNRLLRLETKDPLGTLLQSFDYALDPTGRRARVTELDGRTIAYSYDEIYRLTEERITPAGGGADSVNSYTYDPVGNRVFSIEDGVSTAYAYDQNDRLLTAGGLTYQYDTNGNQTQVTEDTTVIDYGYDQNNRLVSAETSVSGTLTSTVTFGYDVDGNRVLKDNNGQVSTFVVDTNAAFANVLAETDATGLLIVEYLHGDDLYRQVRGGAESYFHYDGLSSTRTLTDASGTLTDGYKYDAWGNLINQAGFTENEFLFTGEQFDAELENYYLRARYYDPKQGRFRTQDPFGGVQREPLTLHKYLYANVDPINVIDPSGKFGLAEFSVVNKIRGELSTFQIDVGTSLLEAKLTPNSDGNFSAAGNGLFIVLGLAPASTNALGKIIGRVKGKVKRLFILGKVKRIVSTNSRQILSMFPDAKIGVRASLGRGFKGPHKKNAPFDPDDFDVDAFIVSDDLAKLIPANGNRFRSAREIDSLQPIQDRIDRLLRSELDGLRSEPFTFRVFTQEEFARKVGIDERVFF